MATRDPIRVYCKNCGAPAGFDIINQTYRCPNCGTLTGIQEVKDDIIEWRTLQKQNNASMAEVNNIEKCRCSACGAEVVFEEGNSSETCDFCGSKIVRGKLANASQLPELIIPFYITPEEAKNRMLDWGHKHGMTPEGKSVVSNIDQFRGYYLPYQLVRGPVQALVERDGNRREYNCAGFLNGTAVNTSKQLDNIVLNEIEPFDWSQARPFEYGYIAGHNVKLRDVSDKETDERIRDEVKRDFLPEVEKVMQTTGVQLAVSSGELSVIPALLPVYFIKKGNLTAVMNGQTGKIAVYKERKKKSVPWVIEPAVITILLTVLLGIPYHFNPEALFYGFAVFGLIVFSIMSEGRTSLVRDVILKSRDSRAERQDGVLEIQEGKDILRNPYDNTPVFFETDEDGTTVPVKIKFYSIWRWLSILIRTLLLVFLPAVIAAPLALAKLEPGQHFGDIYHPMYGAAWYVLTFFVALIYFVKGVRRDVYDHPLIYRINPDGTEKLIGKYIDRRVGILSMFGVGEPDKDGKRIGLIRFLWYLGKTGFWLAFGFIVILLGSTCAIFM